MTDFFVSYRVWSRLLYGKRIREKIIEMDSFGHFYKFDFLATLHGRI